MEYSTPIKKLVRFFEESRDTWKEKALAAKKKVKLCNNRIVFLETSKAKMKANCSAIAERKKELELQLSELQKKLKLQDEKNKALEEYLKKKLKKIFHPLKHMPQIIIIRWATLAYGLPLSFPLEHPCTAQVKL